MHSMHQLSARAEHEPLQVQVQVQQQQQMLHQNEDQQTTMTVLESLNPAARSQPAQQAAINGEQQVANMGHLMAAEAHLVQQHLVQSAGGQQPQLHQLQPSQGGATSASQALEAAELAATSRQQQEDQTSGHLQQQQQQHRGHQVASNGANPLRQRPQIEGIVAEGGGPIVQWLLDNYEIADGESLPRSTVYNHYLAHCRQLQMASVNAASFGKLIRSVFVGLKTRRLGTRGHSKYHYFGVRAKQHIQQELLQHQETSAGCSREAFNQNNNDNSNQTGDNGSESDSTGNGLECGRLSSESSGTKRLKRLQNGAQRHIYHHQQQADELKLAEQHQHHNHHHHQQHHQQQQQVELEAKGAYHGYHQQVLHPNNPTANGFNPATSHNRSQMIQANSAADSDQAAVAIEQHCELADFRNHLGANWATLVDEHWPPAPACKSGQQFKATGGADVSALLELFEIKYKSYYKRMVELLSELKFLEVEHVWMEFWQADLHPAPGQEQRWCSGQQAAESHLNGAQQQQHPASDIVQQQHHLDYQQQQPLVGLTFNQLYQLTSEPAALERINLIDYSLFAAIESFLLPDMLSPIPRALAQHIRLFAKNIGPWIELAVKDYEPKFAADKSKSARAFGYALRRYTWLNHLSTASRAIWEKRSSLAQMSMDLSLVDLRDIEHQVSLMSRGGSAGSTPSDSDHAGGLLGDSRGCLTDSNPGSRPTTASQSIESAGNTGGELQSAEGNTDNSNLLDRENQDHNQTHLSNNNNSNSNSNNNHQHNHGHDQQQTYSHHPHQLCAMQPAQLIQNFLHLLEDPYPANSWPDWCRNLVESRVCGLSIEEARNFVLKWNFYISLIMKELTLRSAPSFGSFQLIRLLFDEYIFYLVVTRLAQAQHKTPAQLLGM